MERGPLALFGAIIAVGLGPAMWLGVQFGEAGAVTTPPPAAVTSQTGNDLQPARGGLGAGDEPGQTETVRTEPKANSKPLKINRNPRPVTTSPSPTPSASDSPAPEPSTSSSASPPPSDPTDPPTESSTPPSDPPVEEEPDVPPVPPVTNGETDTATTEGFAAV